MRLFVLPDGRVDWRDRCTWLTSPLDLPLSASAGPSPDPLRSTFAPDSSAPDPLRSTFVQD